MLRKVAILVTALGLVSGSALAADLPVKEALPSLLSPQSAYNWTGWYGGGGIGYQAGTATGSGVAGFNVAPHLWFFGLNGGYRLQLPDNLVLALDLSAPIWVSGNSFAPPGLGTATLQPNFILASEFQLGYAIGRWLPFVGLGVGFADIKATLTPIAGGTALTDTQLDPLYMITFGVNYAWTDHVVVGLRYDHIELDQHNYTFATPGAPTVAQAGGNSDGISAMLQYKF